MSFKLINQWHLSTRERGLTTINMATYQPINSMKWQLGLPDYASKHFYNSREKNVCVDVGAHYGFFTNGIAQRFKHVHSIEMQTDVYECLKLNTSSFSNVTTYNLALGSSEGFVTWDEKAKDGTGRVKSIDSSSGVKRVTLDSLNLNPDLIKIDVEGDEFKVLQGSVETLKKYKPVLIVEMFNAWGDNPIHRFNVFEFLENLQYKCVDCRGQDYVFVNKE